MVKTGGTKLCHRASPSDCNACFPEISPARFLRRENFIRGLLDVADYFVSPSQFLVDRYVEWGLDRSRFIVIENGLDIAEPAPARALPQRGGRRSRFGYFGQITQFKGVDILLDAVTCIPESVWCSLLRILSEQRDAASDALDRLDDHSVDLVGELTDRDSGILLSWPPDDLQQHRRNG
jgi:glycosyltransferase involved in cell wall biosynthesis